MDYREEILWDVLVKKTKQEDEGKRPDQQIEHAYLNAIMMICDYGVKLAKTIRNTFPMYTLHDDTHICNVLRLMKDLLGERLCDLSRDETAMLLLSACCHDIGMSYSDQDKKELLEDKDRLERYLEANPGEYVNAYMVDRTTPVLDDDMIQNFLRSIHHERIKEQLNKIEWPKVLLGRIEEEDLIHVCRSHGENCSVLEDLEPSHHMDLRFCAILLRLADILDFDTSRAPEEIYEYCGFGIQKSAAAQISKEEWDKHRGSSGFKFDEVKTRAYPYPLGYKATCMSMQIEQAVNCYLDWVDRELEDCRKHLRKYNGKWKDFILPDKIERRIESKNYVSGQYRLSMDQDQVLNLFTGENLYRDPSVFVRELLQNAIDAVRTRKQLDRNLPPSWRGQINIRTWRDQQGYHWFRIEDNGTGMTEDIIQNYFLKIGCSYYNSDEFRQAKLRCHADPDYTPISRFGIGILSCFMGDKRTNLVEVSTKHFRENGRFYPALRLSMHGINGYFYLANREENHNPGPMIGKTEEEQKVYLQDAGTAIAVRTSLFQTGKYRSFREIVDNYVRFPEVAIHYEDEAETVDYPTEQELMDAAHLFQSLETDGKRGILKIPVPEEEFQKLYDEIPELKNVRRPLPNILIKCIALDEYTESPYLSGIVMKANLDGEFGDIDIKESGIEKLLRIGCTLRTDEEGIEIVLRGSLYWDNYEDKMPISPIKIKIEYMKDFIGNDICIDLINYFLKYNNSTTPAIFRPHNLIFSYNGISCEKSMLSAYYVDLNLTSILCIVLLKDKYRPTVNIGRDRIDNMDLESMCDLALIFRKSDLKLNIQLFANYLYQKPISMNSYGNLLKRRTDWIKALTFTVKEKRISIEELNQKLGKDINIEILYSQGMWDYSVTDGLEKLYLRENYFVMADISSHKNTFIISKGKELLPSKYGDYFPSFFFLHPLHKGLTYLTNKRIAFRTTCNADHRLSHFIIQNAEKLDRHTPGILHEMIRILIQDEDDKLIQNINLLIASLRSLPDGLFSIPADLELTEDDLC